MITIHKCQKCNQFDQEAEDVNDTVCLRCKTDIAKGHTQLTERNAEETEYPEDQQIDSTGKKKRNN